MKLTRNKLKQIIKEQLEGMMDEVEEQPSSLTGSDAVLADSEKREVLLSRLKQLSAQMKQPASSGQDAENLKKQFDELYSQLTALQDKAIAQLKASAAARAARAAAPSNI